MAIFRVFEQLENFHAWQSQLQARIFYISCFHRKFSQYLQLAEGGSIIAPSLVKISSMNLRLLQKILIIGCSIVAFQGCVYRMDIPQGNRVDAAKVEQVRIGMSRNQVRFLLGTPAVVDLYQPDMWHYVYFLKTGDDGKIEQRQMTLKFVDDLLAEIDGSLNPG
jgi:outer membrane protein assembly factor BamE